MWKITKVGGAVFLITDKAGVGSGYIFAVWFGTNGKFFW